MSWPDLVEVSEPEADEAAELAWRLEALQAVGPALHEVPPEVTRRRRREDRGELFPAPTWLDRCTTEVLPVGPPEGLPVRLCLPAAGDPDGIYLYLHGGGWVLGACDVQDPMLARIADRAQAAVVSVGYRLAPEHPFPAGADDCEAVAQWLVEHGHHRFGTDRMVVGGESAGAHLALLTLLRMRDRLGLVDAFLGANLECGVFDLSLTPSARAWGDHTLQLSTPILRWFVNQCLPGTDPEDRRRPEVSPLYADLFGLPPVLLTAGHLDPLLDDSLFLHSRLLAAEVDSKLEVWPGAVHDFPGLPHALGRRAADRIATWIADRIAR